MYEQKLSTLTPRERQCLRIAAEFRSSKEIAAELGLTKNTVDNYIKQAVKKLDARDRRGAIAILAGFECADPSSPRQIIYDPPATPRQVICDPARAAINYDPGLANPPTLAVDSGRVDLEEVVNGVRCTKRLLWVQLVAMAAITVFQSAGYGAHLIDNLASAYNIAD